MLLSCFYVAVASRQAVYMFVMLSVPNQAGAKVVLRSAVCSQESSKRNTRQLNLSLTKRHWSLRTGKKEKFNQAQFHKYLRLIVKPTLQKTVSREHMMLT